MNRTNLSYNTTCKFKQHDNMIKSKERVEFNLSNILDTPTEGGVYAFWTKPAIGEYVPIYVGKTNNLQSRMKQHRESGL